MSGIEEIYNLVNRIYVPQKKQREATPEANRSQWLPQVAEEAEEQEQVYDTLENVVKTISRTPPTITYATPTSLEVVGVDTTTAPASKPPAPESLVSMSHD